MKTQQVWMLIAALIPGALAPAQPTLTLERCRELALGNNATLQNSALEVDAAHQTRMAALTTYFPTVKGGGAMFKAQSDLMELTTSKANLPVYDGNPAHIRSATQYAYMPASTLGLLESGTIGYLSAVQPVFAGGRIINGNKLASLGEDVSEYKLHLRRNEILLRTEEQFWQVVSLREKLATVNGYEAMLASLQRRVEDAHRSGLVTKSDVLKVRLKRNDLLLTRTRLQNGITLATMALCQFIGVPYDSSLTLVDSLTVQEAPEAFRVDHGPALESRAEYKLLQAAVRAEELESSMKFGSYLPEIGVGVSGMYLKIDGGKDRTVGMVFGTVSIPLSGWWEASHTLSERGAREKIAENALKDNGELLLLQMERAWRDLTEARQQVQVREEGVREAEENLAVNQDSYEHGMIGVADLLEAQAQVQQSKDQLTDARAGFRTRLVTYLQVTGR